MKRSVRILIISTAVSLTGCAAWNNLGRPSMSVSAPAGSKSVAVAVIEERLEAGQGPQALEPNDATRKIAEAVVRGFGPNRKLAPPMSFSDFISAQNALRGTGTDRQILIRIQRYRRQLFTPTGPHDTIGMEVYDRQGRLLASSSRVLPRDLGWNTFLPMLRARQPLPKAAGKILGDLLFHPDIRSALP